ncbi:unnamed protein product [Prunus armeniaca]
MSSPKTRAKGSSSSLSPPYISGTGVDKHAIEIRSKLHSKYLSRSYPSSEVRNNTVKWSDWIDRLFLKYGAHWKRAGIYDAILLSKQSVNRDENLLAAALCFWNSASNTFDFRPSPMSPTLLHMAQIFGFMPYGRPANAIGDYHRRKNGEKVAKKFTISSTVINQNCSFSNFLKRFCSEKDKDQQHMFFLLYWLNRFVFPNRPSVIPLKYGHLAKAMHNHTGVGLGPTVLPHMYKNLHSATLDNPLNISSSGTFWMIQIWLEALHEEVCCTVASGAQKKLPLVQAWVQTFEVPEDEAAKIDFRKKFLNVMLTRDLTFGGGKPPNSHLGGEVYQPN